MSLLNSMPPGRGPFSRLLSAVVLLVAVTLSLFLGTVLLLTVLGAGVLLALVFYLRFLWLRRQPAKRPRPAPGGGVILEGEFTVSKPTKTDGRQGR